LSFFYLENELPRWLDGEISKRPSFNEIGNQAVINKMDTTSPKAYHMVCADKGSMVSGSQDHQIWKYEDQELNMRTYGKYLKCNGINLSLKFWIGIVVQNKTISLYLWFGTKPTKSVNTCLTSAGLLEEEHGNPDFWYKKQQVNSGQVSDILTKNFGCDSPILNDKELEKLETDITKAIGELLDVVEQTLNT
jgi:hypothetical protein